jgi:Rv0078B-related antitoxin
MSVKFSEEESALIDVARGAESRSEWLREVALAALRGESAAQSAEPAEEDDTPLIRRFRLAFSMHTTGLEMYRQRMRRDNLDASDEEIEALVQAWLSRPRGSDPEEQPWRLTGNREGNHGGNIGTS